MLPTCDEKFGLEISRAEQLIIDIRGGRWYSGDHRLTRCQQDQLTQRVCGIIENARWPRVKPTNSIRDLSEGNRHCRRHQDRTPGKGAADHRSHNQWGSELPMVRCRFDKQSVKLTTLHSPHRRRKRLRHLREIGL